MTQTIRLGTRKSPMAVRVAEIAKGQIEQANPGVKVEVLTFVSEGDRIKGDLKPFGGKGTFIKDLEQRLMNGEIDCAIHALKDIPGDIPMPPQLMLSAYMKRKDPRDALVLRPGLAESGIRVLGTSSPRRTAVLKRLYPGTRIDLCRGNVNTRLAKLDGGEYDALVLSAAGLDYLGYAGRISRYFDDIHMLPAVGQGTLVLQARTEDLVTRRYLQPVDDMQSRKAAEAERAFLFELQANCHSAVAAHCRFIPEGMVWFRAVVCGPTPQADCIIDLRQDIFECDFNELGKNAAEALIKMGCGKLLTPSHMPKR